MAFLNHSCCIHKTLQSIFGQKLWRPNYQLWKFHNFVFLTQKCRWWQVLKFFIHNHKLMGGCRGLPLLPMQHSEMAHINFQSWVFVSKTAVNKILKLDQKSLCATLQRDANIGCRIQFSYCPVFGIICNSMQFPKYGSLFSYN